MPLIRGDELRPDLQRQVLAMYVHRHTIENAHRTYGGSCPLCEQRVQCFPELTMPIAEWHARHMPIVTDAAWLRAHAFYVTRRGQLDLRRQHCEPAIIADAVSDVR